MILLTESGQVDSFVQFVTVVLLFLVVLVITYGVTRWISGIQKTQMVGRNMEIVDTMRISSSKYLQIVRAGDKYFVVAVCKDTVTMLTEISKDTWIRMLNVICEEGGYEYVILDLSDSIRGIFDVLKECHLVGVGQKA